MGDQRGYNLFHKEKTAFGGVTDKRHCDRNTRICRLEVTNCDFKLEMEKIFDEVIEWTLRLRKKSSRSDSSGL